MVKRINSRLWFCCPECGKKLLPLMEGAYCRGVLCQCRACRWQGEIEIGG